MRQLLYLLWKGWLSMSKFKLIGVIGLLFFLMLTGCSLTDVLTFSNANFRVENTTEFYICGIDISDLGSISPSQIATVAGYWFQGECPVDFITINLFYFCRKLNKTQK